MKSRARPQSAASCVSSRARGYAGIPPPQSIGTINPGERTTPSTMKLTRPADATDTTSHLTSSVTFEIHDAAGAVIYTSPAIRMSEKVRYLFAITPNIGPGPSPIQMMAIDGTSGVFTSTGDEAALRGARFRGNAGIGCLSRDRAERAALDTTMTLPAGGVQTYVVNDDPDTDELELIPVDDATL